MDNQPQNQPPQPPKEETDSVFRPPASSDMPQSSTAPAPEIQPARPETTESDPQTQPVPTPVVVGQPSDSSKKSSTALVIVVVLLVLVAGGILAYSLLY